MGIAINTNVASLNAQRNLSMAQANLAKNLSHLSSGLRINSASDDAAGLAISEKFKAQISSVDQASRNANDGISLTQVADGALNQVSGILVRMRTLATQSANGTLTASDRSYIDNEFTSLKSEVDRISAVTDFNGNKLLDGSTRSVTLQVGSGTSGNDQIAVNLFGANDAQGDVTYADPAAAVGTAGTLTFALSSGTKINLAYAATDSLNSVVSNINNNSVLQNEGITAKVNTTAGNSVLELTSSPNLASVADSSAKFSTAGMTPAYNAASGLASLTTGAIGKASIGGSTVYLSGAALDSAANAVNALQNIDSAIKDVSSMRATLGAAQNRLEYTMNNLGVASENLSAANSRIRDVDVASETAAMTRNRILSQAGVAVLAQANQLPSAALSLLKG